MRDGRGMHLAKPLRAAAVIVGGLASTLGSYGALAAPGYMEEIVVTAQRRTENIQDVPVSVTAVTGPQLSESRVLNIENISAVSPSISFRKTNIAASSSNIQIRGIGTTGNARTFEGAVGVFIDGVYRSRSGQALTQFLDVEQLQILRGPQGTLFGKNTSAGALLLESIAPDPTAVSGYTELDFGSHDHRLVRGAINTPIGDNAAFRIAAIQTRRDGYFDDPNGGSLDDVDDRGVKAQLLIEPTDTITLRLIADYADSDSDCCYATADAVPGALQPLIDSFTAANGLRVPSKRLSDREAVVNPRTRNDAKDRGVALYATVDFDAGTLSYTGATRRYNVDQLQDADFSGADILDLDEIFESDFDSHEVTFSGDLDGPLPASYVVGVFYSKEQLEMGRTLRWGTQAQAYWDVVFEAPGLANAAPGMSSIEVMDGKAESLAFFTHWDVELSDRFNLIVGARYSRDEKEGAVTNPFFRDPLFDPMALAGAMPGALYDEKYDDNSISGTIALQYRPTDNAMLYASYNRGYKAGGVNMDINAAGTPGSIVLDTPGVSGSPLYEAETVDAYELGAKIDWLDRRARTNVALFYTDLKDLQVARFLGLLFDIDNASSAEAYGIEVEQIFALNDIFEITGAVTWLPEAHYGDDPELQHLADRRFSTAPEVAGNIALNAEFPLANGLLLSGRLETQYTGSVFTNSTSNLKQDSVTLVNLNVGIGSESAGWRISGFVQNLTDEDYVLQHFNTPLQGDDRNAYVSAPRTYGVTARYAF